MIELQILYFSAVLKELRMIYDYIIYTTKMPVCYFTEISKHTISRT